MIKRYFLVLAILIAFFVNGCGGGSSTSTPSSSEDKITVKSVEIK